MSTDQKQSLLVWLPKESWRNYTNTVEPNLFPEKYTAFVPKREYDALKSELDSLKQPESDASLKAFIARIGSSIMSKHDSITQAKLDEFMDLYNQANIECARLKSELAEARLKPEQFVYAHSAAAGENEALKKQLRESPVTRSQSALEYLKSIAVSPTGEAGRMFLAGFDLDTIVRLRLISNRIMNAVMSGEGDLPTMFDADFLRTLSDEHEKSAQPVHHARGNSDLTDVRGNVSLPETDAVNVSQKFGNSDMPATTEVPKPTSVSSSAVQTPDLCSKSTYAACQHNEGSRITDVQTPTDETLDGIGYRRKIAKLEKERDGLKYLLDRATSLVVPGVRDTGDAYLKLLRDAEKERAQLWEDRNYFKREFESCCERDRYSQEQLAELRDELDKSKHTVSHMLERDCDWRTLDKKRCAEISELNEKLEAAESEIAMLRQASLDLVDHHAWEKKVIMESRKAEQSKLTQARTALEFCANYPESDKYYAQSGALNMSMRARETLASLNTTATGETQT